MSRALKDIGVCLAIILASAVIYWDSLKLRAGVYDPLGSGMMPRMVAAAIIVLCLVAILQSLAARSVAPHHGTGETADFQRRPWLAVAVFCYLVIAATLLALRIPFGIIASGLLFVSILTIKRGDRSVVVPAAICAVLFGFGLAYLFGSVFSVDLP